MTELTEFQRKIRQNLPEIVLSFNEPMCDHTSFRIGGPAAVMAFPTDAAQLQKILKMSAFLDIEPVILGAGTNVLAPDGGVDGLVICLKDRFGGMHQAYDTAIYVSAGVTMTRAAVFAANLGLAGMEFAHGIPGTVGGGVYMNAGAYGGEICQICEFVEVMDRKGNIRTVTGAEMGFSYRHSMLEESGDVVIAAQFRLRKDDPEAIRGRMKELMQKRSASQPLDKPSAGSAFKRPVGGYAAALIDQAGLRGFCVGDAAISEKHAGFAVNLGNATAEEVKQLLRQVADKVYEHSGIRLEPEVRIW